MLFHICISGPFWALNDWEFLVKSIFLALVWAASISMIYFSPHSLKNNFPLSISLFSSSLSVFYFPQLTHYVLASSQELHDQVSSLPCTQTVGWGCNLIMCLFPESYLYIYQMLQNFHEQNQLFRALKETRIYFSTFYITK